MPSKARLALKENLKDVKQLLKLHEQEGGNAPGRRFGLEVLNKTAIVLITACWEAYCEDIAEEGLEHIVTYAKSADTLPDEIKKLIAKELKNDKNELAVWKISDDKWKDLLKKRLQKLKEDRNRNLNTPKHKKIDELFESAIGLSNVSSEWTWAYEPIAGKNQAKLDKYVELRGEIAHRGKANTSVQKWQVEDYLNLIKKIAAKTGGTVNTHVKSITGNTLWK
jgi:DNA-binding transcriptional MerR regulator